MNKELNSLVSSVAEVYEVNIRRYLDRNGRISKSNLRAFIEETVGYQSAMDFTDAVIEQYRSYGWELMTELFALCDSMDLVDFKEEYVSEDWYEVTLYEVNAKTFELRASSKEDALEKLKNQPDPDQHLINSEVMDYDFTSIDILQPKVEKL